MADNIKVLPSTDGTAVPVAADDIAGIYHQRIKVGFGADGTWVTASADQGNANTGTLRVAIADDDTNLAAIKTAVETIDNAISGSEMQVDIVSGTVTANLSATDNAVLDQIDSNTDYGAQTGGGTEASALRVTIANNSTGVLSVDDNGGALTVDGTVTANLSATDNAVLDTIDAVLDQIKIDTEAIETAVEGTLTVGSHAVTNAGTFAVQVDGDALTALQLIDDAVAAEGSALGKGILLQGDDGTDRQNIAVDTSGNVQVDIVSSATLDVSGATVTVDGSGVTQPVSGTVTANLGATDNGVLDAIQAAVETIDNAISGSEMQVDIVGSLPAGTAAIGKLAANSGVDIGDVDVTSVADQYDDYDAVAASTDEVLGATGATGDYLAGVLIIPATTSPGSVDIGDGSTDTEIFAGGASSVLTLHPFYVPIGASSVSGAWSIITGSNVACIGFGRFT